MRVRPDAAYPIDTPCANEFDNYVAQLGISGRLRIRTTVTSGQSPRITVWRRIIRCAACNRGACTDVAHAGLSCAYVVRRTSDATPDGAQEVLVAPTDDLAYHDGILNFYVSVPVSDGGSQSPYTLDLRHMPE